MTRWTSPSAKVTVATIAAFLGPILYAIAKEVVDGDGVPATADGWVRLVAKAVVLALGVGGSAYVKRETNPAPSAKAELIAEGEVRPA